MSRDDFSLLRGGPAYRLLHGIGMLRPGVATAPLLACLLVSLALLPLVALAFVAGTLLPGTVAIPLSGDYTVIGRFVFAVPILVLAAPFCDGFLRAIVRHVVRGGLVDDAHRHDFARVLVRGRRLRDSNLPELSCLVLAIVPALFGPPSLGELTHLRGWMLDAAGTFTAAGRWFHYVALPVFRFVGLAWLWRFALWSWWLWRLARLRLRVQPTHPDHAGGLAFLGMAQECFCAMPLAGGAIVAGNCLNHVVYQHQSLASQQYLLGGWIVAATLLLALPLLVLGGVMLRAKRHALFKYAALGQRAAMDFDMRWKKGAPPGTPSLLESNDPSALADFNSVFDTLRSMSIVPLTRRNLLVFALSAALPLVPVVFVAMSFDELVKRLLSIIA